MPWNGGSLEIGGTPPIGAGIARSPGRPTRHHDRAAREVVGVVGDLVHGVVGDRHPHAAVAIGVGDRAARLAQVLPHLGGVRVVVRVGVVEVGREVVDRAVVVGVVRHPLPDVGAFGRVAEDRISVGETADSCGLGFHGVVVDGVGHVRTPG